MWRGHSTGQYLMTVSGPRLAGDQAGDAGIDPVAAREEGQTLHMVPVEVAQQQCAGESVAAEQLCDPADTGACIKHKRGSGAVVGDGNA